MSKNKKGKIIALKPAVLSPEKYIKTQTRLLPIAECLITKDWENVGISNIFVSRRHKNDNITTGIYLVDMYCLGVKDANYQFNLEPADYEYLKQNAGDVEECDYVLAHNLIYGAIAFAEDCGFKPHVDFSVSQYILEADDEQVELMDIAFGYEGRPLYIRGPFDDDAKINRITNTLTRTVGEGNFEVLDDEDDDEDENYEALLTENLTILKTINKVYEKAIGKPGGKKPAKNAVIGKTYKLTEKPVMNEYNSFDTTEQEDNYRKLLQLFEADELDDAITGLQEAIALYPDKAQFYNLLQGAYLFTEREDEMRELIITMYSKFPAYLFAISSYADLLIKEENPDQALELFNGTRDLDQLYPGQKLFNRHEAAIYYATMCRCFIALDDIYAADPYMDAIIKKDLAYVPGQTIVDTVILEFGEAKMKKVASVGLF